LFLQTTRLLVVLLAFVSPFFAATNAAADAQRLEQYLSKLKPADLNKEATRIGKAAGKPALAPIYEDRTLLGHAFLNSDVVDATGYSGKPIHILVAMAVDGTITALKLVKHSEPIVLVGIPEEKVTNVLKAYIGKNVVALAEAMNQRARSVDIVSGATVTIMVMDDSVIRSALQVYRARTGKKGAAASAPAREIDPAKTAKSDWFTLVGDGSVRRLKLSVAEINAAFQKRIKR